MSELSYPALLHYFLNIKDTLRYRHYYKNYVHKGLSKSKNDLCPLKRYSERPSMYCEVIT